MERGKRQAWSSFFGSTGFYIALLLCVVVAGIAGLFALLNRDGEEETTPPAVEANQPDTAVTAPPVEVSGVEEEIPENQPTLEGNASEKSHYLRARTGLDCFADDTGLEVEALDGAPGVHSARYASDGHDFAANNRLLLRNLEGVANRRARFRTVISLLVGDEEHLFEGVVEGRIVERESGAEGFGYDPLFVPDGCDRTFAEMSPDEKNAVSHRGRAVRKLAAFLRARGEK